MKTFIAFTPKKDLPPNLSCNLCGSTNCRQIRFGYDRKKPQTLELCETCQKTLGNFLSDGLATAVATDKDVTFFHF